MIGLKFQLTTTVENFFFSSLYQKVSLKVFISKLNCMRLSDKTETYEALNQHIVFDTKTKPIDWFLYDRNHRHERVEQPLLLGEKQPKKRCS